MKGIYLVATEPSPWRTLVASYKELQFQ